MRNTLRYWNLFAVILLLGSASLANRSSQSKQKNATSANNTVEMKLCFEFSAPGQTSKIKFIAAIPSTIPDRQKIVIKYSVKPSKVFHKNAQRYAEFVFIKPEKNFTVEISIRATLFRYDLSTAQKKQTKNLAKGPGFKDFLKHERYIEKDDPVIQQIASSITGSTELETVKNIYEYVINNMQYGGYNKENEGALQAAKQKKGDCSEYSDLFVALCRAKNIPARTVGGYVTDFKITPRHDWAEVYLEEYGWVPFDPTIGDKKDKRLRQKKFHSLKPVYIYRTHLRNHTILKSHDFFWYQYWGDKIEVEDSIKFN